MFTFFSNVLRKFLIKTKKRFRLVVVLKTQADTPEKFRRRLLT